MMYLAGSIEDAVRAGWNATDLGAGQTALFSDDSRDIGIIVEPDEEGRVRIMGHVMRSDKRNWLVSPAPKPGADINVGEYFGAPLVTSKQTPSVNGTSAPLHGKRET
jgi:hypothetical protein